MVESVELDLEVIPNSGAFKVMGFNPWTRSLRIKVREKALKGKANEELQRELGRLFNARATLIAGRKGRHKRVLLEGISQTKADEILGKP